ncbi:MAG: ATP-binding cassette domain-containing protein [Actinomycetota bacterium]|nr:ATP-binding cassette domain-containing protein [Actinomycetota bacterium]
MNDVARLRTWLRRAAPRPRDLIKAIVMASLASLAGTGLFIGAIALLAVSANRPGLAAIGAFLIGLELVAFLRSPLRFGERMSTHRLGFAAVAQWRQWLMESVGNWNFSRWQRYGTGDLLERSLSDTEELQDLWLRGVIPTVASALTVLASDAAVAVLAPRGRWWMSALAMLVVQAGAAAILLARLGAQVRADRTLRARRGEYLASLVSSRAAAPEIERLGASEFLGQRDALLVHRLRDAEDGQRRTRQRDGAVVVAGPLAGLAVVALTHPRSAPVWIIVASLVAVASFEALLTLRAAVQVAVAVTAGAERLDELAPATLTASAPWPQNSTLRLTDVTLQGHLGPRRVSATITPGSRVAISGPSGAGKSTLLRAMARLDDPLGGNIAVGDTDLARIAEEQMRDHVVLVPSEPGLVRGYVRDVLGMGRTLEDSDLDVLARLGLRVERNDQWSELSRGERQRVALVRALVRRPSVLMLDEPTSALGEAETTAVLEVLSSLSATVIVATHDPLVLAWCDQVIDLSVAVG